MATDQNIIKVLRDAYSGGWEPTLKFIEWAAKRPSTPEETIIATLQKELRLSNSETADLVKGIEDALIGTKIVGRHGLKSRVKWLFTLGSIAKAARGEANELARVGDQLITKLNGRANTIKHTYQLRSGEDGAYVIPLPGDLTQIEADRLASFIRTLPFDRK